jgi:hypothetical protein
LSEFFSLGLDSSAKFSGYDDRTTIDWCNAPEAAGI